MKVLMALVALATLCNGVLWGPVHAQAYPNRAIHVVVPSAAGGPTDAVARLFADKMSAQWGQAVIVENRAGGNNIIGTQAVAKAAPDGYNLLLALDSTLTMHPSLYKKLPYDPAKDFAPVALAYRAPLLIITDAAKGPKSIKELVQLAKAKPGTVSFGAGTLSSHLCGELLKSQLGADMLIVPYKGSVGTTQALLTNDVTFTVDGAIPSLPHIKSGKFRVLANLSQPITALPNLPSFAAEMGIPGFDISTWVGFVVPSGTASEIVGKLNEEIVRILALPDVREKLSSFGGEPGGGTPAEFASFIRTEIQKWSKVIRESGFKVE
jgi:tripartite-type tricarboxylate transporter receptor subunit TctC